MKMTGKPYISLLLLLALLLLLTGCNFDTTPPGGFALVYGISLYDPDYPEGDEDALNLTYSNDDAEAMAAMFEGRNYTVRLRIDTQATYANILADISYVSDRIDPGDNFVFYFSGHGVRANIGSEPALRDNYDEWILLYGSIDNGGLTGPLANMNAALSDDHLLDLIADVPTEKKVVILDSCNSGGFIGNEVEVDLIPQDSDGDNTVRFLDAVKNYFDVTTSVTTDIPASAALVMTAAGEREDTFELNSLQHGIFTYYLLAAPYESDANRDGYVTAGECFDFASLMIENLWAPYAFVPRISGGPVDFVLFEADSS